MELIKRSYPINSQDDDKYNISGIPVVYNNTADIGGWFREIIEPGALDKTDLKDVLFFVNHNMNKIPLARSRRNNINSTMLLEVVNEGLSTKANLDTENNQEARALVSAVKRGDIDGMSFAFIVDEEKWEDLDTDYPTRKILGIKKIVEISAVNMPAYKKTNINARNDSLDNEDFKALERAKSENIKSLDSEKLLLRKRKILLLEGEKRK